MKQGKQSLAIKIVLLLFILMPFNLIGIIMGVLSVNRAVDRTMDAVSYSLRSNAELLRTRIRNTHAVFYDLSFNDELVLQVASDENSTQYRIDSHRLFQELESYLASSNTADVYFFYVPRMDDYIQAPNYSGTTVGSTPYLDYMKNYDTAYSQWFLSEDKTDLIRVMYDPSLNLYYGASIDIEAFLGQLNQVDDLGSLLFTMNPAPLAEEKGVTALNEEIVSNIYLSAEIGTREIRRSIGVVPVGLLIAVLVYLALIPILLIMLRRLVLRPLDELNHAHSELEAGHEDFRIAAHTGSLEFDNAYHSFNEMADSIQSLHQTVIEKELFNKQLQIDYLQLQIRPHFLLNTFNLLYTLVQRTQRESAQDMILFLSDYFRYLFRSGHELQLFSKELKLIEDYLDISKLSYPDSFEVVYQIDPSLLLMRVPPLLFHSFIENIIAHALTPAKTVHIVFSGDYDEGQATFYISDDGLGMSEDAVTAINHAGSLSIDDGKNVGIKNSIRRLKYYYGEEATVECDSSLDYGTTFIITIPYNLEES